MGRNNRVGDFPVLEALPRFRESDSPHLLHRAEFAPRSRWVFHRERGKR